MTWTLSRNSALQGLFTALGFRLRPALSETSRLRVEEAVSAGSLAAQALFISGGAKEMTSRPGRAWGLSPDGTVMTTELPGSVRLQRGRAVWRPCLRSSSFSSPSSRPSSIFWCLNFLPCLCAYMAAVGVGQKVLQRNTYWRSGRRIIVLVQQSRVSISALRFSSAHSRSAHQGCPALT